ncbi:hypothetical protein MP638_003306 [Amoeboaphelidium occidentale]|nr:hypothetical protein MP638_003306 [Amoeboaphelidium occidentale]
MNAPQITIALDPEIYQEAENINKDVDFRPPHLIKDRIDHQGRSATVSLVEKVGSDGVRVQAARKQIRQDMQAKSVDSSSSVVKYELNLLKKVSGHSHLPTFLGAVQSQEVLYLYYQPWGIRTLREWLNDHTMGGYNRFDLGAQWMLCLCRALNTLHTLKPPIMHRDLKPDNIVITSEMDVCLIDFGICKLLSDKKTQASTNAGTENYMAPEILNGDNLQKLQRKEGLIFPQTPICKLLSDKKTQASTNAGTENYMAPEILNGDKYGRTAEIFSMGCIFTEIYAAMNGLSSTDLLRHKKEKPFGKSIEKTLKALQIIGQKNAAERETNAISGMLAIKPLERPAMWEVHENLRSLKQEYRCCNEELPYELSDENASAESPTSSSSKDLDQELAKQLDAYHLQKKLK